MIARVAIYVLLTVLLLTTAPVISADNRTPNSAIPADLLDKIDVLKCAFHEITGLMEPAARLRSNLKKNAVAIEDILSFSNSSTKDEALLANYLINSITAYNTRFKPGTKPEDKYMKWDHIMHSEIPDHGVSVDAALLLQIARHKESPVFTRKVLKTLSDAVRASIYWSEQCSLRRWPDNVAIQDPKTPCITTLGEEISYLCKQHMVDAYNSKSRVIPKYAKLVLENYQNLKAAEDSRPDSFQDKTMNYIDMLIAVLPAK